MLQWLRLTSSFVYSVSLNVFYQFVNHFYQFLLMEFKQLAIIVPCDIRPNFYHQKFSISSWTLPLPPSIWAIP